MVSKLSWKQVVAILAVLVSIYKMLKQRKQNQLRKSIQESMKAKGYSVGIIGAGVGGVATAKKCMDLGIPFHIYEMAHDFGGTWLYNTYPGCACDVTSHCYSFSWAPNPDWSQLWVNRDEFFAYFQNVARKMLNLEPHATFNSKVLSATFVNNQWTLECQDVKTGAITRHAHTFLMCSVGQLNIPFIPESLNKTKDRFRGLQFHSARWPSNVDLKGKRVACIGTGSSAIQFCPLVAKEAKELVVFQRSPGWIIEKANYSYPEIVKKLFRYVPFARLIHRYYFLLYAELFLWYYIIPGSAQKPTATNAFVANIVVENMKQYAPKKEHDRLLPKETLGCKRMLLSSDWLTMFGRENVKLVSETIKEITDTGLLTASGDEHKDFDVIIYGTGFETGSFFKNLPVFVVDEKTETTYELHQDIWKNIPQAYRGVTFDKVPNFACTYGPNTNVNHSTIISMIEAEVEHFGALVSKVVTERKDKFVVTTEAFDAFNKEEQELLSQSVFNADCDSWYKRNEGKRILNNWHGSLLWFWHSVSNVNFNDYQVT